jgi:hypothetical protein
VGFGYRDTGLSLAPRLSNAHIWRAGASFKPFEDCEPLRNLELGTDWFLYAKNRAEGAISDSTADRQSGYVGWEMDYSSTGGLPRTSPGRRDSERFSREIVQRSDHADVFS